MIPPSIVSVTTVDGGTYHVGQHLDITVQFDEPVHVEVMDDQIPKIILTVGPYERNAFYNINASSSTEVVFRYTVQRGDMDSDGIGIVSFIDLGGASIRDLAGNNAEVFFCSLDSSLVLVDAVFPFIKYISITTQGNYIVDQHLDISFVFSEAMDVDVSSGIPRFL